MWLDYNRESFDIISPFEEGLGSLTWKNYIQYVKLYHSTSDVSQSSQSELFLQHFPITVSQTEWE